MWWSVGDILCMFLLLQEVILFEEFSFSNGM